MRIKGFFWFLTILLTVVCLYQLSFTWVANNVEADAEKQAISIVSKKKKEAMANNNGIAIIGTNNDTIDFNNPESEEIAKGILINQILRSKADTEVYPVLGSTFSEVKKRSLAFGLDLVGGMSVTLEVSEPEFVKSQVKNQNDISFTSPYEKALVKYENNGTLDFIDLFVAEFRKENGSLMLNTIFYGENIEITTSDDAVIKQLRDLITKSMDGIENVMSKRINQFGVAQPNIQKDAENNRLYIELPGVQDEKTVAEKLQSTANLEFFETYDFSQIQSAWAEADALSLKQEGEKEEISSDSTGNDLSFDETPSSDVMSLSKLVEKYPSAAGYVKNDIDKSKVDALLNRKDIKAQFDSQLRFMWGAEKDYVDQNKKKKGWFLYACKVPENGKAKVNGSHISKASQGYDQMTGDITVDLSMNDEGIDQWSRMTTENIGRLVAISMDNVVYSAPVVRSAINNGNTQISGDFTFDEANDLAGLLNGGALPAPCVIKEQTKVGPTIGKENTRAGLLSFAIAFLVVFIYMYFYYGKAGIVADIALLANVIFIFGSLASFGAVLTLAGIAGIVLTIGMAVDANVLIFERIREEQTKGKDLAAAVKTGFQKALSSIIDANVTTLLTAIVLKVFGTGPIESFATTLIIGIFSSVFAALIISRLIFEWWLSKGNSISFDTKLTKNAFKGLNINFLGKRKMTYAFSAVMVIGSLALLFTQGISQSVEFTGGRTYGVKFEKSAENDTEFIKKQLANSMKGASVDVKTKSSSYNVEITTNYLLNKQNAEPEVKAKLDEALKNCESKLGKGVIQPDSRFVSSKVSEELETSSKISIALSLLIIFAYIFIRFGKWQFSISAIVALFHDVIIVLGLFSLLGGILPFNMDIDQAFVAAILTVIGYSINDTVVVFDRIREDLSWKKESDFKSEINGALNSTLSRTINTSMTTFVVLLIIFVFGGAAIKGFIFALIIGILVGTYSSMFVATPLLVDLTKKIQLKK
ncbi:protein translocase subunit SecD [Crocinitomicaceae bacterium]|nr:protein translocase subunit SecD [Crocinitomicaceae bacterium]